MARTMDDIPNRPATWQTTSANAPATTFTITDLASEFDITTRTIRFYETKGLITPQRDRGARIYSRRDRARLILILRGKRVGYSLKDIREYLDLYDSDPTQLKQLTFVRERMEQSIERLETKAQDIRDALEELRELRDEVERRIRDRTDSDRLRE